MLMRWWNEFDPGEKQILASLIGGAFAAVIVLGTWAWLVW